MGRKAVKHEGALGASSQGHLQLEKPAAAIVKWRAKRTILPRTAGKAKRLNVRIGKKKGVNLLTRWRWVGARENQGEGLGCGCG